jgi:hypothetical protein
MIFRLTAKLVPPNFSSSFFPELNVIVVLPNCILTVSVTPQYLSLLDKNKYKKVKKGTLYV